MSPPISPYMPILNLKLVHCPCCHLIRDQKYFIDTVTFARNTLCNDCMNVYRNACKTFFSTGLVTTAGLSTVLSSQTQRKAQNDKKATKKVSMNIIVPQSRWVVTQPRKSQRLANLITAKLVHHRLYQDYYHFIFQECKLYVQLYDSIVCYHFCK